MLLSIMGAHQNTRWASMHILPSLRIWGWTIKELLMAHRKCGNNPIQKSFYLCITHALNFFPLVLYY